ncbi:ATP synthase F1 subunit epsilon [uncultured Clostridium sp.]|jgi:F-type H+-transporting ATPase subunit epsilon|uniref:ATP synthase F1 subunit epsilon n=1 Tax=uncultured Clostridium sp. TaxID=59620 RepID=UPI00260DCE2A|nr:ATP synthase F1 subunit epsilon [uncultured Clostridium sp.]
MNTFKLSVLTPHRNFFDGNVKKIVCTDLNGEFSIFANHQNFITATLPCVVSIEDENSKEIDIFVAGGIIEVREGEVSLCVDTLETKEDIDIQRAERAKSNKEEQLKEKEISKVDEMLMKLSLNRAIERLKFAKK